MIKRLTIISRGNTIQLNPAKFRSPVQMREGSTRKISVTEYLPSPKLTAKPIAPYVLTPVALKNPSPYDNQQIYDSESAFITEK